MTEELPERAARAFERHDAFEREGDGFRLTTTRFDGRVTATETGDGGGLVYEVTVRAPTLNAAVEGEVGDAVEAGWFETYERRLGDAPATTRADVTLEAATVTAADGEAVATLRFRFGDADRAPDVAKAFAEYVEGTYAEGIVPGYEYRGVAAELLSDAGAAGGGGDEGATRGGTPL
ncbi:MAG: DUF5813 family protein [Halorientalis sp.]